MILKELGAKIIMLHTNSRLVVNQYLGTIKTKDSKMRRYIGRLKNKCSKFARFEIKKIPRSKNSHDNALATLVVVCETNRNRVISIIILVESITHSSHLSLIILKMELFLRIKSKRDQVKGRTIRYKLTSNKKK